MTAKRLCCGVLIGAVVLAAGLLPASGQDTSVSKRDANKLTDFSVLAVTPGEDDESFKLVPIGEGAIDPAALKGVIRSLPGGFLGIKFNRRDVDEEAEAAQCHAACTANPDCQRSDYQRPTLERPVGVCRLKRLIERPQSTMAPVADETVEITQPAASLPTHTTSTLPDAVPTVEVAAPPIQEIIPPPPRLGHPLVIAFPLPPRPTPAPADTPSTEIPAGEAVTTASEVQVIETPIPIEPPRDIVPPPFPPAAELAPVVPAEPVIAEASEPVTPPLPPAQIATPARRVPSPAARPRGLPLWAVIGAIAFMLGGAGVYWKSHQRRMLTRITTRLVSNGMDRHVVAVESTDKPDMSLRFIVRNSAAVAAPETRILAVADGAFA
ncbi:MAG: hypothetical protein KBA31_15550 [Alphaproteobacteria bacterium]|nr:hypothetical protein [Alphaproteobacteria bacterium]